MPSRNTARAFTLIELLVVVTIIIVLLALLSPALEKAVYQGQLAVCGSNLHNIVTGANTYAIDFKRRYPHRGGVNDEANSGPTRPYAYGAWRDTALVVRPPIGDYDDRPAIKNYINLNGHLNCPLNKKLDIAASTSHTEAPYQLWYGFQFRAGSAGTPEPGMIKLGDRLHFTNGGKTSQFNVLASDMDDILQANPQATLATHPDRDGILRPLFQQDAVLPNDSAQEPNGSETPQGGGARFTISRWQMEGPPNRGLIDRNFGHGDGSVSRIIDISLQHAMNPDMGKRLNLEKVPIFSTGDQFNGGAGYFSTLPTSN